jgi:hypothetical protein
MIPVFTRPLWWLHGSYRYRNGTKTVEFHLGLSREKSNIFNFLHRLSDGSGERPVLTRFVHSLSRFVTDQHGLSWTITDWWSGVYRRLIHECVKPVSHRTRLGTRFQYGILGYTRVDWYEYWAPTVPGDELVRFRLECSTSMYEQSTDILGQARCVTVWTRFANDFHTIVIRFQVRSNTVCYGLVRLNTTFSRLTGHLQGLYTVPPTFVRVMLELSLILVCFDINCLVLMAWLNTFSNSQQRWQN